MDSRKRILVISSKRPFPVQDGASIRTSQMIRMLSQIFEVDLVYTCNPYKTFADLTELRCFCRQISEFLDPSGNVYYAHYWAFLNLDHYNVVIFILRG